MKKLIAIAATIATAACTLPTVKEAQTSPVREQFVVAGNVECNFEKAVSASAAAEAGGIGVTSFLASDGSRGWLKWGYAVVDMTVDGNGTLVTRRATIDAPGPRLTPVMEALKTSDCPSATSRATASQSSDSRSGT